MTRPTLAHHLVALNASADTVPSDIHLLPFQRDWAVALCRADKDALDTFVAEVAPQTQALFKTLTTPQVTGPARRGDTV
ncbi:hypothetical protein, partial [Roseospira navarrensis]